MNHDVAKGFDGVDVELELRYYRVRIVCRRCDLQQRETIKPCTAMATMLLEGRQSVEDIATSVTIGVVIDLELPKM